jgi:Undecaprenyl-phosphate glucose phosphotransferase
VIKQANTLLVVMVTFLVAYWIRFGYEALPSGYLAALLLTIAIAAIIFPGTGAFRREFEWAFMRKLRRLVAGWTIVVLVLVSIAAMLKVTDYYSRIWFGTWVLICAVGLVAMLLVTHSSAVRARKKGSNRRDIVLVGAGDTARRVEAQIRNDPLSGMQLVACFGVPWSDTQTRPVEQLAEYVDRNHVQGVWIALPWEEKLLLDRSLEALTTCVVDVNIVPDMAQYQLLNQNISEWGGLPVISLAATPMTDTERRIKAVGDWFVALVITLLLSPLLIAITLAIWLGDGRPAIFRQRRLGVGGEAIEVLKFRTMKHVPDDGFRQATPDDDRVTPVGRFLRKTSLDELPQIFNVLKGQMSLVGPRPHPLELNDEFKSRIPKYMLRHKVKPGITGWAQVNGFRGQTDTPEKMALRIQHDLWYIQNWSLWLDLKILLMTPFVMMHRNAY